MSLNASIVEDAALEWFLLRPSFAKASVGRQGYGGQVGDPPSPRLRWTGLGYAVGHGPHLAPGEPAAERDSFSEAVLVSRLREAIRRLNPAKSTCALDARHDPAAPGRSELLGWEISEEVIT